VEARGYFWTRFPETNEQDADPDWALFGLPRSEVPDLANTPSVLKTDVLTDPVKRSGLVALFLTLTHGCP
jgi:hypothetical protein